VREREFWSGNLREGGHMEEPGVDGRIILKRSSRSEMWVWTWLMWLRI
jgi:hypothetical protein